MSFILDAIKKSENERKRSKQADVHSLQNSASSYRETGGSKKRWLLLLTAIGIISLVIWWAWPQVSEKFVDFLESRYSGKESSQQNSQNTAETATDVQSFPSNKTFSQEQYLTKNQQSNFLVDDELPPRHQIQDLWQLPADFQSLVPKMDFSFHVFSRDPGKRTIIINGRRVREGQMIASGLRLRVITETGLILYYQGQFFHIDVVEQW